MTRRERQVLHAVNDAIARTGVSPTSAELGAGLEMCPAVVSQHVRSLVAQGYLRRTRWGRGVLALDVLALPGGGLTASELAWCKANPERVWAMMRLAGQVTGRVKPSPAAKPPRPDAATALADGLLRLETMSPGEAIEIQLPRRRKDRRRVYLRLSTVASRLWGPGGAVRQSTERGVLLTRVERA